MAEPLRGPGWCSYPRSDLGFVHLNCVRFPPFAVIAEIAVLQGGAYGMVKSAVSHCRRKPREADEQGAENTLITANIGSKNGGAFQPRRSKFANS